MTSSQLYIDLLKERARRSQSKSHLEVDRSLELLKQAAVEQRYVIYGDLTKANKVVWSKGAPQDERRERTSGSAARRLAMRARYPLSTLAQQCADCSADQPK